MKNILILNLTRMGDLLMNTPLITGLKKKYPGAKVSVLSNSKFSEVCKYNSFIDNIYEIDIKQFETKIKKKELSFLDLYTYLEDMVGKMQSLKFDMLINLTHSKLSAVFSSLLDIEDVRGFIANETGQRLIRNPWFIYFSNLLFNRPYNMFHLVDIYMRSGDLTDSDEKLVFEIPHEADQWAADFLKEKSDGNEIIIGFQPAASREDRRWAPDKFAELATRLSKNMNATIIIFGVPSEGELALEIIQKTEARVINAVGKTTIPRLAGLLKRCSVLVTNDTGTMHIASAVETPIAALFFTHALVHETGPYGGRSVTLQSDIPCSPCSHHTDCNHMMCLDYITPAQVEHAISLLLENKDLSKIGPTEAVESLYNRTRLYSSRFDEEGMIEYFPLLKKPVRVRDVMAWAYRFMWTYILGSGKNKGVGEMSETELQEKSMEAARKIIEGFSCDNYHNIASHLYETTRALHSLHKICSEGEEIVKKIILESTSRSPDSKKMKIISDDLQEVDIRIEVLGNNHPEIGPILKMFSFGKENLEGDNVKTLAGETMKLYQEIRAESSIMEGLLSGIMSELALQ